MTGRTLYPKGTRITVPDDRGGYAVWELRAGRKSTGRFCAKCGDGIGWAWVRLTDAGNPSAADAARRCDALGCRPAGTAVQPDGFTEATR